MKKTTLIIITSVMIIVIIFSLIIGVLYRKTLRDHLFPSSSKSISVQSNANETELKIDYKWSGFKEHSTVQDYLIIRYEKNNIQLDYKDKDKDVAKTFYKSVKYLQGDFSKISHLSTEEELVIPIEPNAKEGEIIIPIKYRNDNLDNINIFYAHEVSLPMDMPTGWIKKVSFKQ